jgi:UMF1 family MFS transporter
MNKKRVWSWAFYDWANSTFYTTVVAGFFPIFFEKYWSNPSDVVQSTYQLGMANSLASIIVAFLSPFLGAIADRGSAKKKFLIIFAFFGALMTSGLFIVKQGEWELAVIIYVLATIGFMSGNIFYDSLLTDVAEKKDWNYVSSLGYALGYLGGGILFAINVGMYLNPQIFGISDSATAIKISFITVSVWVIVFTIPIILFVPEPDVSNSVPLRIAFFEGYKELKITFTKIRNMKVLGTFLFSYWLYIDGVDTIIKMTVKMASSLGFETSDLIIALLMVQFIAFPAAILYNIFSEKIGAKNAIFVAIGGYTIVTFLAYFMVSKTHLYILAAMIGLFQGGIQALSRSLYAKLIPKNKETEFFGFFNMLGKFAAILGPFLMGWVTLQTGNVRIGILSILILFISGAFFLYKVDFEQGEIDANKIY